MKGTDLKLNTNVATVRHELNMFLGRDEVTRAHRTLNLVDYAAIAFAISVFIGNFYLASFLLHRQSALVLITTLIQGWLITIFALLAHDLFVHRRSKLSLFDRILGLVLFLPLFLPFSLYRYGHLRHHKCLGTADDTEQYKQGLDSPLRRIAFTTIVGLQLVTLGRFSKGEHLGYRDLSRLSLNQIRSVQKEKFVVLGFFVITSFITLFDWRLMLVAFWLPVIIVAPFLNSSRILIEHTEIDEANPYWIATAYKTGVVSQVLFLADSGDCHLLHHIYARVPWYRMPRLVRLAMPFFIQKGVSHRTSLLRIWKGWFISNLPHRSRWFPD
jgi:fatty acid desaturase